MVCGACYRRVDATRSFCTSCGSAVFIERDERTFFTDRPEWQRVLAAAREATDAATEAQARLPRTRPQRRVTRTAQPTAIQTTAAGGCLGSLIRLAIFAGVLWFLWGWLLSIQEVRALLRDMQERPVSSDQLLETVRAVRDRILDAILGSSAR